MGEQRESEEWRIAIASGALWLAVVAVVGLAWERLPPDSQVPIILISMLLAQQLSIWRSRRLRQRLDSIGRSQVPK